MSSLVSVRPRRVETLPTATPTSDIKLQMTSSQKLALKRAVAEEYAKSEIDFIKKLFEVQV